MPSPDGVWVFAYGSLIWNPGFEFTKVLVGHIKGYSRRFYQGSDSHRGSPNQLGRVATLVDDEEGTTWGLAFLIEHEETALAYLKERESSIGGYITKTIDFYPKDEAELPLQTLVYIALPENRLFLGPSPTGKIAADIASARGFCGYNVEYLFKLVAFMRIELPHITDEHLDTLETEVKDILEHKNPSLLKLFREAVDCWLMNNWFNQKRTQERNLDEYMKPMADFRFIDSVPNHQLRCMKKF